MPDPIADYDVVALLRDLPNEGLERGQPGTIVLTHHNGEAYEVEFILRALGSQRSVVATVQATDLLKLRDYKHVPDSLTA